MHILYLLYCDTISSQPLVSYLGLDQVVEAQQAQHTQPQPASHCLVLVLLCRRSIRRKKILVRKFYANGPRIHQLIVD